MSEAATKKIRLHTQFRYKLNPEDTWTKATIISTEGKASGKNCNWWNIGKLDGPLQLLDLRKTTELEILENAETTDSNNISKISNEQHTIDEVHLEQNKVDDSKAKEEELNQWKDRGVYEEIVCLVVRSKLIDSKPSVKARL